MTGETLPATDPPREAGTHAVQVVRTVPEELYDAVSQGDFRLLEAYVAALRGAERYIYLESQFLWSPEIVAVLGQKLREPPRDDFRLVVPPPAKPNNGQEDTRGQIGVLVDTDDGAGRFLACSLFQAGAWPPQPVYVHAKVAIVDDRWLTIGSANLNEHSLFNDTEMNVVAVDESLATALRKRLWAEHLECAESELDAPVHQVVDERWLPHAEEQLHRLSSGHAPTRRLSRLPRVSRRSRGVLGPLNGLFVDG